MGRLARVVVPGMPHHVTQRGNRRQQTFFNDADYSAYLELMAEWCQKEGVEIWGYCLMANHIHLIAVPKSEEVLRGLRSHACTGWSLGDDAFVSRLERLVGRVLRPRNVGESRSFLDCHNVNVSPDNPMINTLKWLNILQGRLKPITLKPVA